MNKMAKLILLATLVTLLVTVFPASAGKVTTIDFENLPQGEIVGTHYPGVSFSDPARIDTFTGYFPDYPPHSGGKYLDPFNYIPCTVSFTEPVSRVGFWHTSAYTPYIEAYGSDGKLIKKVEGTVNLGTSNYLEVTGQHIAYVVIYCGIVDDFQYETEDTQSTPDTSIPEFPNIALPVAAMLGLIFVFQRKK